MKMIKAVSGEGINPINEKGVELFKTNNNLKLPLIYVPVYIFQSLPSLPSFCVCGAFKRKEDIIPRCKTIAKQFGGNVVVYEIPLIDWTGKDKKGGSK